MVLLTVFTPTYNRAHTLPEAYCSLKAQTSKNFLWLIVDDGSTDRTARVGLRLDAGGESIYHPLPIPSKRRHARCAQHRLCAHQDRAEPLP